MGEELRIQYIEEIKKKAHKEEEELREIAFINELQAQNNKLDIIYQVEHAEENCGERLAEIAEERAKKVEQREEREAKAEERRKAIEAEKLAHKTAMLEKRREREEKIKKKAHKEEEKLREIAFINELQAQNNKLDIIYQVEHAEENCGERLA